MYVACDFLTRALNLNSLNSLIHVQTIYNPIFTISSGQQQKIQQHGTLLYQYLQKQKLLYTKNTTT